MTDPYDEQLLLQARGHTEKLLADLLRQHLELSGSRLPADQAARQTGINSLAVAIDAARAMLQSIDAALKAAANSAEPSST